VLEQFVGSVAELDKCCGNTVGAGFKRRTFFGGRESQLLIPLDDDVNIAAETIPLYFVVCLDDLKIFRLVAGRCLDNMETALLQGCFHQYDLIRLGRTGHDNILNGVSNPVETVYAEETGDPDNKRHYQKETDKFVSKFKPVHSCPLSKPN